MLVPSRIGRTLPIMITALCLGILAWSQASPKTKPTSPAPFPESCPVLPGAPAPARESSSLVTPDPASLDLSAPPTDLAAKTAHLGAVTVLENTPIRVISDDPMSTRQTHEGALLRFTVSEDVVVDHVVVIPRGATAHGTVVDSRSSGTLTGSPELTLRLTSLDLGSKTYPLYTYLFRVEGTSKTKPTERKVRDGAVIGAIVGGAFSGSAKGETTAVGRAAGMGTGAVLGAGIGTAVAAATPGPILDIPAESQMDFYLALPIAVEPMSAKEAARLSEGLHRGGPMLYVRGETP